MSALYYLSSPPSSSPPSPVASSSSSSSSDDDQADGRSSSSKRRRLSTSSQQQQQVDELAPPAPASAAATCQWEVSPGQLCGEIFAELQPFITHVHDDHIGNGGTAYICNWVTCPRKGKVQTSRFALVSHFRSHSGEKPFLCPEAQCDKSFTRSDALAKHMRIQHSINPTVNARNVPAAGPTAKHPEREPPPDAPGGRPIPKGGEKAHKLEEDEWDRMDDEIAVASGGKKRMKLVPGGPNKTFLRGLDETVEEAEAREAREKDEWYDSDSDDSFTGPLMPPYSDPAHPKYKGDSSPNPGSRPRHVVRYLIGKAKHREAMREREELEAELEGVKMELKASWEWKEKALDAVLKRDLREEEVRFLIEPVNANPFPSTLPPAVPVTNESYLVKLKQGMEGGGGGLVLA